MTVLPEYRAGHRFNKALTGPMGAGRLMDGAARFSSQGSDEVIWVTRLNGTEMVINSDLVESIESTPDTVLMLVDGKRYVVAESAAEVVTRIRAFRASILAHLDQPNVAPPAAAPSPAPNLYVLPTDNRG